MQIGTSGPCGNGMKRSNMVILQEKHVAQSCTTHTVAKSARLIDFCLQCSALNFEDQEVKDQGHRRPKLDLEP